jgi:hypothetical protein
VDDHDALQQAFTAMPEWEDLDLMELLELQRQAKNQFKQRQAQGAPVSETRRE